MTNIYQDVAADPLHLQLMEGDSDIQAQMLDKSQPPKNTSDSIIPLGNQTSKPADTTHPDFEASARRARNCDESQRASGIILHFSTSVNRWLTESRLVAL